MLAPASAVVIPSWNAHVPEWAVGDRATPTARRSSAHGVGIEPAQGRTVTVVGQHLPWRAMLTRSAVIALAVGSLLVCINHGDHLCQEPVCAGFYWKLALSYVVPFVVSLASTTLALRDARGRSSAP
jgi:hypothetical protein